MKDPSNGPLINLSAPSTIFANNSYLSALDPNGTCLKVFNMDRIDGNAKKRDLVRTRPMWFQPTNTGNDMTAVWLTPNGQQTPSIAVYHTTIGGKRISVSRDDTSDTYKTDTAVQMICAVDKGALVFTGDDGILYELHGYMPNAEVMQLTLLGCAARKLVFNSVSHYICVLLDNNTVQVGGTEFRTLQVSCHYNYR
jgi:hypothetical protein